MGRELADWTREDSGQPVFDAAATANVIARISQCAYAAFDVFFSNLEFGMIFFPFRS